MADIAEHPWNTAFTWTDHDRPPTTATRAQVDAYDRDGFFVFTDAFTSEELAAVVAELDAIEARTRSFLEAQDDERLFIAESGAITFSPNLVAHNETLATFTRHPVLVGLCRDLVGDDVNLYWDQAVYKYPDKPRRFPWHQDNGYTFIEPQAYLTCWIPLVDATVDNGCPHVIPGLHRRGTLAHTYVDPLGWQIIEDHPDAVPVPAPAGSIVVFSSLTPHLTGPNVTGDVRKAYIVQYAPAGAVRLEGTPGEEAVRVPADDPAFQFPVLREGVPV